MEEVSKAKTRTGWVISGLMILFLLMDAVMKFIKPVQVLEASAQLGLDVQLITPVGAVLLLCTVLYAIPRTAVAGAVLLTGFLGGAVAINLRAGTPLWTNMLFPVYMGTLVWLGLYLRDARVRQMLA